MAIEINTSAGNTIEVTQSDGASVTFNQETSSVSVSSPASTSVQVLEKGVKGDKGDTGPQGETGPGVASGGTENQFIQKNSATDYDTKWSAYTLPAADGDDGQVLTTNGAATVTFAYPKTIAEDVKNVSGGPLTKGTPVHVTGSVGNLAEVVAADAATNYPAHFVLNEDLADDAEGLGIALGFINNVDVPDASIYNEGDTIYLGASGGFTTTKPTGASNSIQNLGIIIKVNTSGNKISGIIMGAGRANDVPNIATGNIWAGNASGVATATDTAYIDIANSRVGIGTASPTSKLDVNGGVTASGPIDSSDATNTSITSETARFNKFGLMTNRSSLYITNYNASGSMQFGIGGVHAANTKMYLSSAGRVGIGTTSPSAKLDVVGLANINDGSNNVMISSGNTALTTGSGNTAVGYLAGDSNTEGSDNSFVGINAGRSNTTGSDNSLVGRNAGYSNTSGSSNSFVGRNAGFSNTGGGGNSFVGLNAGYYSTGNSNVLIGREAGYGSATSAYSNTVAVGYQALKDLTTGISNTSVGHQALTNVTTASSNTAVGYNAGFAAISAGSNSFVGAYAGANSTGSSNTAVGFGSSYYNTTGSNNVAIGRDAAYGASGASTFSNTVAVGYEALQDLTTGAGNTAVGYLASTNVTSGSSNVSLGYEALNQTQGGNNNIAIGRSALNNNVGGGQNVAIGRTAGYSSLSSGNVFLGYQAGYYETGGNKLYIANSDTTTPLIYGEFDNEILNVNGKLKPNSITVDDEGLSAAGDYGPGAEIWYQGTSTPSAGFCYYLDSTGGWTSAQANAAGTATGMLAVSAGTDSDVDGMVLRGFVQISNTLTGSVGDAVYLETSAAGRFTTTKPTGAGNFVRRVGYLAKGTNVIYFNPSPEWEAL